MSMPSQALVRSGDVFFSLSVLYGRVQRAVFLNRKQDVQTGRGLLMTYEPIP